MHIVIEADGVDKSNVHVKHTSSRGTAYADAMAIWVNEDSDDCAARPLAAVSGKASACRSTTS